MTQNPDQVLQPDSTPKEVAIAGAIVPYPRSSDKAKYLGFLACGLSVREALQLTGRSKQWLSNCRHLYPGFEKFVELEERIPEFRRELSKEYVEIEFFRNFRLALEKDYRILKKSLGSELLTKQDHDYLVKLRSQYTPQALSILEAIVSGTGDGFNFSRFVAENPDIIMQASRTETVTVARKLDAET